jgi:predicted transport protein
MRLFECYDQHKTLSAEQFQEALSLIESYIFRRAILGEQTRGYWQVFANLAYRIDPANPLISLKVGLARLRDNYRFPADDEFEKALEERDLYGKRVCFDLLERLENHGSKELTDVSTYTIEHVMPQNSELVPEWQSMLGPDWREIQRVWLHRLGNLTLTGYNSTYSDRPFEAKQTIQGGFEESSVRLNRFIREQVVWTAAEMERRGKLLAARALAIWPNLDVPKALIDAADQEETRALAARRDAGKVQMTPKARQLFEAFRSRVLSIDSEIIEFAEQRSVSYHHHAFFVEVLPRKHRITLLFALDFNEVDDPAGIAGDATQWKFFFYAAHQGGVFVSIAELEDIEKAMPIVRQAHAVAST